MAASPELIRRYKQQIAIYRQRTSGVLVAAWGRLPGIDEEHIPEFERMVTPSLVGAKAAAVSLSAAFFAASMGVRPAGVRPRDVLIEPDLRGPFRATWHALAMGRPIDEAVLVGRSTADAVGFDFVQSTARRTGDVVAAASGQTVRWSRVPGANSCDWCQSVAAGNTWATAEAADFGHERDDCDVVPV